MLQFLIKMNIEARFFSSSRHTIPNSQIVRTLCGIATYFATLFSIVNFKQHPFGSHISLYLLVSNVAFELKEAICLQVPLTYCTFFHQCYWRCSFLFRGTVQINETGKYGFCENFKHSMNMKNIKRFVPRIWSENGCSKAGFY